MDPRLWTEMVSIEENLFSLFFNSYAFSLIINVKMNNVKYTISTEIKSSVKNLATCMAFPLGNGRGALGFLLV